MPMPPKTSCQLPRMTLTCTLMPSGRARATHAWWRLSQETVAAAKALDYTPTRQRAWGAALHALQVRIELGIVVRGVFASSLLDSRVVLS